MPHVRDVRAIAHDDHDAMLVAALAAGDLTGPDRNQAVALIESCSECASLHDDLRAIARATAALPPPIAMPARDFGLSPQQAARLRPRGWRRLVPRSRVSAAFTRPLGVGLATFGLIGLLVTNVPLPGASTGSAPTAASGAGGAAAEDSNVQASTGPAAFPERASAAASAAAYPAASVGASPVLAPVPASAASGGAFGAGPGVAGSAAPQAPGTTSGGGKVSISQGPEPVATERLAGTPSTARDGSSDGGLSVASVRNVLFGAAILLGLALLLAARRGRRTA